MSGTVTGALPVSLDRHLERLVDAAMTGDLSRARLAYADAQAHADLAAVGLAAHVWVARELQAPLAEEQAR